jgi:alkane 1-monooxygenase
VLLPTLDYILPVDHTNVPENRVRILEKDKRFLIPLYLVFFIDVCVIFWSLDRIKKGEAAQTPQSFLILALSVSQIGAVNAVVGHELFHRKNMFDKVLGTLSYAKAFYGHTFIAHIKCHHKKVATPEDPQTSRLGESIFEFYARAILDSAIDVWNFENSRLAQQGENKWYQILIYNRMISFTVGQIIYNALIWYFFGDRALCFNLLISFFTTLMFETVNYLEHYGL